MHVIDRLKASMDKQNAQLRRERNWLLLISAAAFVVGALAATGYWLDRGFS